MAKKKQKKKKKMPEQAPRPKDFLDMIAPAAVKFNTDHFILGSRYHTAMTLKSYPPMTDELALLRGLGDMGGVNLRLTARQVTPAEEDAILRAASGTARGTRFLVQHRMHTRQQWLAFYALPSGALYVDDGAAKALTEGKKSLLPPGIVRIEGDFDVGEVVTVCRADTGKPLGRGIVNYTAETLLQLKGTPGPHGEAIHRDNWASLP